MDNITYFAVGFKSFAIERIPGTAGIWYEWTERSRNAITRARFNKKSMEWVVRVLKEASQTKGNSVRRWRRLDDIGEIFCAQNYNKYGRYISLTSVRGKRRAVLIIPELIFNSRWTDIAEKVARFISSHKTTSNVANLKTVDENISHAEMVRRFKWENRARKEVKTDVMIQSKGIISIKDPLCKHSEVLMRSLV